MLFYSLMPVINEQPDIGRLPTPNGHFLNGSLCFLQGRLPFDSRPILPSVSRHEQGGRHVELYLAVTPSVVRERAFERVLGEQRQCWRLPSPERLPGKGSLPIRASPIQSEALGRCSCTSIYGVQVAIKYAASTYF